MDGYEPSAGSLLGHITYRIGVVSYTALPVFCVKRNGAALFRTAPYLLSFFFRIRGGGLRPFFMTAAYSP